MKQILIVISATLLLFSGGAGLGAGVNIPKRFYVESIESKGGRDHITYIWRDGKRIRYEALMGSQLLKTLVDPDANKITGIFDGNRQFTTVPYSRSISGGASGELIFDVLFSEIATFSFLGNDSVGGSNCKKYRVEAEGEGAIMCWIDQAAGVPLKLSDEQGGHEVFWRGFSDKISLAGIFAIPAGYSEKPLASEVSEKPFAPELSSPRTDAVDALCHREVNQKNPGGKDLILSYKELRRDEKTSTVRVAFVSGAAVPSSMFVMRGFYDIAQARGAHFFIKLKEGKADNGDAEYVVGFSNDRKVDPATYFALSEPLEKSPEHEFMAVEMFESIFKCKK